MDATVAGHPRVVGTEGPVVLCQKNFIREFTNTLEIMERDPQTRNIQRQKFPFKKLLTRWIHNKMKMNNIRRYTVKQHAFEHEQCLFVAIEGAVGCDSKVNHLEERSSTGSDHCVFCIIVSEGLGQCGAPGRYAAAVSVIRKTVLVELAGPPSGTPSDPYSRALIPCSPVLNLVDRTISLCSGLIHLLCVFSSVGWFKFSTKLVQKYDETSGLLCLPSNRESTDGEEAGREH